MALQYTLNNNLKFFNKIDSLILILV